MPRDSNGNYALPLPPVIPGAVIETVWANTTLADIAAALTDSLSRTGAGGLLVPFTVADGTVGAPGLAFANEPTSGMYRAALNDYRFAIAGQDALQFIAASVTANKLLAATNNLQVNAGSAAAPSITNVYGSSGFYFSGALDVGVAYGGNEYVVVGGSPAGTHIKIGGLYAEGNPGVINFPSLGLNNNGYISWKSAGNPNYGGGYIRYDASNRLGFAADGALGLELSAGGLAQFYGAVLAGGGIAASPASPAIGINNNQLLSWKDNAAGYSNAGFVWYDSANFLNFGAGGLSRMHLGAGGFGINVPVVLYSGTITFPAVSIPSTDPNTLDDYEEGTFVPILKFGGTDGCVSYTTQTGTYTKIGNRVSFTIVIAGGALSAAVGSAVVDGLPFPAAEYTAIAGRIAHSAAVTGQVYALVNNGFSYLILQAITTAGTILNMDNTGFNPGPNILLSGTYRTTL